ncbi:hypothetical protein RE628_18760 [Paenibacillus sp. D2_2]|uniref:hypothetical protein n=1 Tax=Paenibacillus sp. D2_2 TaxID=3073092 RepID=UPI0028167759|nr:hypothetical protein [Paenibacillus sp. D2_2]WMT39456.1 hypothetical protein RE628_18760 [Paenibacillus sp. D2_2]
MTEWKEGSYMMKWLPFRKLSVAGFSLFQKLLVVFLIAIIPILIVSTLINRSGERTISEEITRSLQSNAHFYLSTFELEMDRIFRMKQQYILDNEVQSLRLFHMIYSDSDDVAAIQGIERRLQQFKDSSLFVESISLLIPELDVMIWNDRVIRGLPKKRAKLC